MIQPTQDTDITSSISPLFYVQDNTCSAKLRARNSVKKLPQGKPPTSFIMETLYADKKRESEIDGAESKYQGSELVKSLGETVPWIIKFSKVIQSAVGSKNPKLLERLLVVYTENMSRDVNTCYSKPYRAAKLKAHISETLIFFHLYWKNIKERVDDHNQYLDKMSEILGMYFDMELKASRRGKDSNSKIVARLLTAMFIYLDNSEEHLFRTLFRVKFITKNYSEICAPIFKKLFAGLPGGIKCVTDVTYVRYLLALKLWKKIKDDLQEKKEINDSALAILGQRTPSMNPELAKIIPKPSESHKNSTLWLLQPSSFDLRKACDAFIKFELNERIISLPESIERPKILDRSDTPAMQIHLDSIDRLQQKDIPEAEKSVDGRQQVKKTVKLRKFKPSFPKLRPGEVVFIDLTAENEEKKQDEGKKKKRRDKKKLKWLKGVTKKSKLKKERKIADKTWIEKADAHSTEDTELGSKWPISENKVSESMQRIESTSEDIHRFSKRGKNICESISCKGCQSCSSTLGKNKYTNNERRGEIESSENLVTSQTSLLNNDGIFLIKNFGDAVSCNDFLNEIERNNATMKSIKQESRDIMIGDSTTDNKNCDKIIINDSSSFNFTKQIKGEGGHPVNIPSTSSNENVIHSSANLKKVKEFMNETCIVSTTASILEFKTEEQINVISGSSNESLKPNIGGTSFTPFDNNPDILKNEGAVSKLEKSFPITKTSYRSVDISKNCCKDSSRDSSNNKLQNSLIQALSLDKIIEIGKDDIDSQSDDDYEEKQGRSGIIHKKLDKNYSKKFITGRKVDKEEEEEDSEFFQIPHIQLCDDLINDNDENIVATRSGKNKVDEFENIDILDSILNGDMSMQDILEEQQHLSMNSISNDTSNNMLGLFTEFFKQSEVTLPIKRNCEMTEASNLGGVSKSLPEGSLGMTGILNSLLDSDLTSIDSPPSDFMYSNVQTVDPRLIRKSPTADRANFLNEFSTASDIFTHKEQNADDNFNAINSLSKKTKDQLFLDQKDSLNSTDLEEFGLNSSEATTFEIPALEEELIQLPEDPLIDENIITQISPSSCESPRSEIINLNEVKSTDSNNYYEEFTSLKFKDTIQESTNDIDHREDLPTSSTLTDFTPPQSVDPPHSPYTFTSSPRSQTILHSPTHSNSRISRNTISANMLTPPPNITQLIHQNNLTPPSTPQQNQNQNQNDNMSRQESATASSSFSFSFSLCGNLKKSQQNLFPSMEKKENCKMPREKQPNEIGLTTQPKMCTMFKTTSTEIRKDSSAVDEDQQHAARLAHVKVALTRLTREEISSRAKSGEHSVLKNRILLNRQEAERIGLNSKQSTLVKVTQRQLQTPQLQHIDLREFSIAGKQNKSVLINLNGKTKPALVFERNIQSDTKSEDIVNSFNNISNNIVYKLTSTNVNLKPATSKDKPYSKLPNVNLTLQNERDIISSKSKSTVARCSSNNVDISKETQTIIRPRCSTRRIKTQAIKSSTKEINVRKKNITITEEPSMKKRKITSKFLPQLLENDAIIYSVNQQKVQEKHSNVIRRDFATRRNRTKKKVV